MCSGAPVCGHATHSGVYVGGETWSVSGVLPQELSTRLFGDSMCLRPGVQQFS